MNKNVLVTAGLLALGSGAQAASLAGHLPAGALLTFETHDAQKAFGRIVGLGADAAAKFGQSEDLTGAVKGIEQVLNGSLAEEAVVGVFAVGKPGKPFMPQVLGATRVSAEARGLLRDLIPDKPGARVGNFTFSRQGSVFVGMSQNMAYFSTDKDLLMAYLGRLSGKAAPRLMESAAYTMPTRSIGQQEMSLYMNFSGAAKVVRSQLGQWGFPRLLSPLVDALDTLGQYAGGLTTHAGGLTSAGAHVVNTAGKDKALARVLTHQTTFGVANIIPADAESVVANACAPESSPYTARWLTRFDLLDPFGFLSDSQLASHLERSAQYLGDECAQVALAGSAVSSFDSRTDPLAGMAHSLYYQRVRDRALAEAELPGYVASVNKAFQGVGQSLGELLKNEELPDEAAAALGQVGDLGSALSDLKMVYGFRGDYVVFAFSDSALKKALDETAPVLSSDPTFQAAQLPQTGAGWQYGRNLPDLTPEDFGLALDGAEAEDTGLDLSAEDYADLTDEERAQLEELDALLAELGPDGPSAEQQVGLVMADLFNRYDGMTASKAVRGNVVLSKSNVLYRW
ncbi:hypothetical protein ACINK0_02530 [Deinococcus sp. VB343]|uniref:DUF3352 domain-containing protein n=1 Tax=Deinococcus sp. VB142 TaxID=3112952 RepID=A0AAU6Q047_9DEIO